MKGMRSNAWSNSTLIRGVRAVDSQPGDLLSHVKLEQDAEAIAAVKESCHCKTNGIQKGKKKCLLQKHQPLCSLPVPPISEELRDAEAELASLNETPGDCPGLPAPASTVKEEVGVVDASEFLVNEGMREIEASNPDSQGWQLWSPSVLAAWGSKATIDLEIDSDVDLPPGDVVPLPIW